MSSESLKRRVAPRRVPIRPPTDRGSEESVQVEKRITNRFQSLSPNSQIYFTKLVSGIIAAIPAGFLFDSFDKIFNNNWFLITFAVLIVDILVVRYVLKLDETRASWPRVILSGTITLFIAFILITSLTYMLISPEVHGLRFRS